MYIDMATSSCVVDARIIRQAAAPKLPGNKNDNKLCWLMVFGLFLMSLTIVMQQFENRIVYLSVIRIGSCMFWIRNATYFKALTVISKSISDISLGYKTITNSIHPFKDYSQTQY